MVPAPNFFRYILAAILGLDMQWSVSGSLLVNRRNKAIDFT